MAAACNKNSPVLQQRRRSAASRLSHRSGGKPTANRRLRDTSSDENSGGKNQNGDDGSLNETTHWYAPGSRGLGRPDKLQLRLKVRRYRLSNQPSWLQLGTIDLRRRGSANTETCWRREHVPNRRKTYFAALTIFGK